MQLGIRLHDTKELPLEERLAEVKKQGFGCAHVALGKVIHDNSVANTALTPGYAMYLRRLFAKQEIDIAVLGCYLNLGNPNPMGLHEATEKYKANIRFAAQLGAGVVGTETGAPNEGYVTEEACFSEEALHLFIKNLIPVVEYAEKMGVIVAIEPVCRHIVNNPRRARRVLDAVDSPNLQIILDLVNLLDETNYTSQKEIVDEAIELLGDDIAVVHLKDYRVENGKLVSIAAGTGEMDYQSLMKFMKKNKPYIHATLEDTTPDNAVAARLAMQKLYDEA